MEHNANPNRLDLCDRDLLMAKEAGCKIVINTDAHKGIPAHTMPEVLDRQPRPIEISLRQKCA